MDSGARVPLFDYEGQTARVQALQAGSDAAAVDSARFEVVAALATDAGFWADWIHAVESQLEASVDGSGALAAEVLELAVLDCPLSTEIWTMYVSLVERFGSKIRSKAASAVEPLTDDEALRSVLGRATSAAGAADASSHSLWQALADFEFRLLQTSSTDTVREEAAALCKAALLGWARSSLPVAEHEVGEVARGWAASFPDQFQADWLDSVESARLEGQKGWDARQARLEKAAASSETCRRVEADAACSMTDLLQARNAAEDAWIAVLSSEDPAKLLLAVESALEQCFWSTRVWQRAIQLVDATLRQPATSLMLARRAIRCVPSDGSLWRGYALRLESCAQQASARDASGLPVLPGGLAGTPWWVPSTSVDLLGVVDPVPSKQREMGHGILKRWCADESGGGVSTILVSIPKSDRAVLSRLCRCSAVLERAEVILSVAWEASSAIQQALRRSGMASSDGQRWAELLTGFADWRLGLLDGCCKGLSSSSSSRPGDKVKDVWPSGAATVLGDLAVCLEALNDDDDETIARTWKRSLDMCSWRDGASIVRAAEALRRLGLFEEMDALLRQGLGRMVGTGVVQGTGKCATSLSSGCLLTKQQCSVAEVETVLRCLESQAAEVFGVPKAFEVLEIGRRCRLALASLAPPEPKPEASRPSKGRRMQQPLGPRSFGKIGTARRRTGVSLGRGMTSITGPVAAPAPAVMVSQRPPQEVVDDEPRRDAPLGKRERSESEDGEPSSKRVKQEETVVTHSTGANPYLEDPDSPKQEEEEHSVSEPAVFFKNVPLPMSEASVMRWMARRLEGAVPVRVELKHSDRGQSRGFGRAVFGSIPEAKFAARKLNGQTAGGRTVVAQLFRARAWHDDDDATKRELDPLTVFLRNLPSTLTEETLRKDCQRVLQAIPPQDAAAASSSSSAATESEDAANSAANPPEQQAVQDVVVALDPREGQCKGHAVVTVSSPAAVTALLNLINTPFAGSDAVDVRLAHKGAAEHIRARNTEALSAAAHVQEKLKRQRGEEPPTGQQRAGALAFVPRAAIVSRKSHAQ
jgi:hypothetical protein